MAKIAQTPTKSPWGVPLVLPHVLLSLGLLIFATMSERTAAPQTQFAATVVRSEPAAVSASPVAAPNTVRGI